jgi:large subunit ribosomal protein L32
MPVPKRKTSKKRRDQRAAGKHIDRSLSSGKCQTCQASTEPHCVCAACGYYKGVKVLRTKLERADQRQLKQRSKNKAILESKGSSPEDASQS